jgi:hypothetical protein
MQNSMAVRTICLFFLINVSACSTEGVQDEAAQYAEGLYKMDAALLLLIDLNNNAHVEYWKNESTEEILTNKVTIDWADNSCEDDDVIHNVGNCALYYVVDSDDKKTQNIEKIRYPKDIVQAHAHIANTGKSISDLAGAGSIAKANSSVQQASFTSRAAVLGLTEPDRKRLERELENTPATDPNYEAIEKEFEALKSLERATTTSIELTESILLDYFEWRLAKQRRKYVVEAIGGIRTLKCKEGSAPNDVKLADRPERTLSKVPTCGHQVLEDLSTLIGVEADRLFIVLHRVWQNRLSNDFDALTQAGDGEKLDPDSIKSTPEIRKKIGYRSPLRVEDDWIIWQQEYERFNASRAVVIQLEKLQGPKGETTAFSKLMAEYDSLAGNIAAIAVDPSKRKEHSPNLYEFNIQADETLNNLVRARQLMERRIDMDEER